MNDQEAEASSQSNHVQNNNSIRSMRVQNIELDDVHNDNREMNMDNIKQYNEKISSQNSLVHIYVSSIVFAIATVSYIIHRSILSILYTSISLPIILTISSFIEINRYKDFTIAHKILCVIYDIINKVCYVVDIYLILSIYNNDDRLDKTFFIVITIQISVYLLYFIIIKRSIDNHIVG